MKCIVLENKEDKISMDLRKEVSSIIEEKVTQICEKYCCYVYSCKDFDCDNDSGYSDCIIDENGDYELNPENFVVCGDDILGHVGFDHNSSVPKIVPFGEEPFQVVDDVIEADEGYLGSTVTDIFKVRIHLRNGEVKKEQCSAFHFE